MGKNLLRPNEAAHLLNVTRWTIYRWVKEGKLEATKISKGSLRIFSSSVDKLIEERKVHIS
jgi:excisionase family DNA binding protein